MFGHKTESSRKAQDANDKDKKSPSDRYQTGRRIWMHMDTQMQHRHLHNTTTNERITLSHRDDAKPHNTPAYRQENSKQLHAETTHIDAHIIHKDTPKCKDAAMQPCNNFEARTRKNTTDTNTILHVSLIHSDLEPRVTRFPTSFNRFHLFFGDSLQNKKSLGSLGELYHNAYCTKNVRACV